MDSENTECYIVICKYYYNIQCAVARQDHPTPEGASVGETNRGMKSWHTNRGKPVIDVHTMRERVVGRPAPAGRRRGRPCDPVYATVATYRLRPPARRHRLPEAVAGGPGDVAGEPGDRVLATGLAFADRDTPGAAPPRTGYNRGPPYAEGVPPSNAVPMHDPTIWRRCGQHVRQPARTFCAH